MLTAIEPRRDGLVQLRNLALGLFVEGMDVLDRLLGPPSDSLQLPLGTPLVRVDLPPIETTSKAQVPNDFRDAYDRTMAALQRGPREVLAALAPKRIERTLKLSVQSHPLLEDHSFFPQPKGWSVLSDRRPVVPMTMMIELMREIAQELAPAQVLVRIEKLMALQWLVVEPAIEVTLRAELKRGVVHASIDGYASAQLHFASAYTDGVPELPPLVEPRPSPIATPALYSERWMFHGPAYQGVSDLGVFDPTGLDGEITVPAGVGSLLDNAGQLLGWWLMATAAQDQLAMPVGMQQIDFFAPDPQEGERVECRIRLHELTERALVGDLELLHDGRLWVRIQRWADHRFTTDDRVWTLMRLPETSVVSERMGPIWVLDDRTLRAPSRDWLMRRYLSENERQSMQRARQPRAFLNERIVSSDARRSLAWERGVGPLFPVETPITGFCAVASDGPIAVAVASDRPMKLALGTDVAEAKAKLGDAEVLEVFELEDHVVVLGE